jgi:hypothetical protein
MRTSIGSLSIVLGSLAVAAPAWATPSTTYWAPSTTYVQPYLVPHITYDNYFWKGPGAAYPNDTGITIGVLPWEKLQLEIGYDLFLPTQDPLLFLLNAKLGTPENTFFDGSPSLAAGIFGMGIKGNQSSTNHGTSYDILYGQIQKNLPFGGYVSAGGYYGAGTKELWQASPADATVHRAGFMGAISSPDINVNLPGLKKLIVVADVQSGKNIYGAAGGGVYFCFNDFVDILTGPVYFFDSAWQPGGKNWLWTVQLDVDIPFKAAPPAPAPAAPAAEPVVPVAPAPAAAMPMPVTPEPAAQ